MMKIFKNIIFSLLILLSAACLHAQQLSQTYPGTWHYDNGSQRFIVKIWQEDDKFLGHYKMVQLNNGAPGATIFDSRQVYPNGAQFDSTIYTKFSQEYGLSGFIYDNTIINNDDDYERGNLVMRINPFFPGCQTCTVTAKWDVSKMAGMILGSDPPFSVPTDITLTKVSDSVVWD